MRTSNGVLGKRQKAKDGTSKLINKKCYGYTHSEDGHLIPHTEESKIVKEIFSLRAGGVSLIKIADQLQKKGILSPTGKEKWGHNAINKILHNEKYIGEVLYQKTYVEDLFEGKQVENTDRSRTMYHHIEHHEAIITREVFELVQ